MAFPDSLFFEKEANDLESALLFLKNGALNEDDCEQLQAIYQRGTRIVAELTDHDFEMPGDLQQWLSDQDHTIASHANGNQSCANATYTNVD